MHSKISFSQGADSPEVVPEHDPAAGTYTFSSSFPLHKSRACEFPFLPEIAHLLQFPFLTEIARLLHFN